MNRLYQGKYYFYLECYTYAKITETSVLLLNTLDNQRIISNDKKIMALIEKLLQKKNNVLEIDFDGFYQDEIYQLFFEEVRTKYMGDLIDVNLSKGEPVNFYPIAKIENNIRKKGNTTSPDFDMLCNSLFNLTIYLNAECTHNCPNCNKYYRQFNCCTQFVGNNDCVSMDPAIVEKIFSFVKFENLKKIHVAGGNLSLYKDFDRIIPYLSEYREHCSTGFKYNNIRSINADIRSFFENRITIIVDAAEIDDNDVDILINDYNRFEIQIIATDECQLEKMMPLINSSVSYKLTPFYNGHNLSFFEDNVFLNEEDLFETKYTIKKIHKNQLMNSGFFGNLTVLPDGNVCVDVNGPVLGNLHGETMLDIISKALKNEDSLWFKTRNTTTCADCLYVDLCPPVSSYELAVGKYNLCHVKS